MSSFKLFGTELKLLKNKKGALIALIGVMLIPIVYCAVLLSATWGPYDNLDNLPVAVVNKDTGGVSDGKPINVGNDLVETLKSSNTLGWDFVSEEDAKAGLDSNKYYMVVEIPEDFSQKVTTVLTSNPQEPELKYIQNEGLNFMGAQVTNSAVERLREQLGDKITATYATTLLSKFGDVGTGFGDAADGSNQIYDGTVTLSEGTNTLLSSLQEKAPDIAKLAAGAQTADQGAGTLLSSIKGGTGGVNQLASGSAQVAAGAGDLQAGANKLVAGLETLQPGSAALATGIEGKILPGAQQIAGGLATINQSGPELASGAQQLANGANDAITALEQQIKPGAVTLNAGVQRVVGGVNQLAPGAEDLNDGITITNGLITEMAQASSGVTNGLQNLSKSLPAEVVNSPEFKTLLETAGTVSSTLELTKNLVMPGVVDGSQRIKAGLADIHAGAPALSDGAKNLAAGLEELTTKAGPLKTGAATLNTGIQQVVGGVSQLAPGAQQLAQGIESEVLPGAKSVSGGVSQIATGNKDLAVGIGTLRNGASQVATGNKQLTQSWTALTNGASQLKGGLTQIADGTATVNTGWGTLTEGATALDEGANKLKDGSQTLATSLEGGAEQVNALSVTDRNIAMFASPVKTAGEKVNGYTYYRDSTAPYILSLALFVGMLVLSFFVDFKKPAVIPGSAISWFLSKWLQLALFAVIQAVLVSLFVLFLLGLDFANPGLFMLFAIFVSLTFMSIVFCLVSIGGNIGRFLALVFIVLQLSITGSNLPIPMLPENLQSLSQFLPLTYSNAGFKSVISLGDTSLLASNSSVLAIWLVVTSVIALIAFALSYRTLRTTTSTTTEVI